MGYGYRTYGHQRVNRPAPTYIEATPEQVDFLVANYGRDQFLSAMLDNARAGRLTARMVECINRNMTRSQQPRAAAEPVSQEGVYELPTGEVFVVKFNKAKTSLYAKQLLREPHRHLEYIPGAVKRLSPEHRCSVERCEELTLDLGACIMCGTELTDPDSVKRGMGPVCRKKVA